MSPRLAQHHLELFKGPQATVLLIPVRWTAREDQNDVHQTSHDDVVVKTVVVEHLDQQLIQQDSLWNTCPPH